MEIKLPKIPFPNNGKKKKLNPSVEMERKLEKESLRNLIKMSR